jgi:hypothetical protein
LRDQIDGLLAVGRLTDDLNVARCLQQGPDALAYQIVIVGQSHADSL